MIHISVVNILQSLSESSTHCSSKPAYRLNLPLCAVSSSFVQFERVENVKIFPLSPTTSSLSPLTSVDQHAQLLSTQVLQAANPTTILRIRSNTDAGRIMP